MKRWAVGIVVAILAWVVWQFKPIDHLSTSSSSDRFLVDCEYKKFRQIMVRKNATAAMIGDSEMQLVSEKIDDVQLDTSDDDRPLLNAIRGQSKTEVGAKKQLTVRLADPYLEADALLLKQSARISEDGMHVDTYSIQSAGRLIAYQTILDAKPLGEQTEVSVVVTMEVNVTVPKFFIARAEERVNSAAENAVSGQRESLQTFIAQHADKRLLLPELKR